MLMLDKEGVLIINLRILNEVLITDKHDMSNDPRSAEKLRYDAMTTAFERYTDVYGKDVEEFKETPKNKLSLSILYKLRGLLGTLISKGRTMLTGLLGGEILAQKVLKNEELSKVMSDMFVDTNVEVYVYTSTMINAYTIPGSGALGRPLMMKIFEFAQLRGILFVLVSALGAMYNILFMYSSIFALVVTNIIFLLNQIATLGLDAFRKGNPWKMSYDESSRKVKLNVSTISVYCTTPLIKLLNNDDELKAVMLHEIGHNLNHIYSIINRILSTSFIAFILLMISGASGADNVDSNNTNAAYSLAIPIEMGVIIMIAFALFCNTSRRLDETYADEFAIKMGYGRELESGLLKMYDLIPEPNLGSKGEWFIRWGNRFSKFMNSILGMYPTDRMKKIKEKTDQYGTDLSKMSSAHIDYTPTDEIY